MTRCRCQLPVAGIGREAETTRRIRGYRAAAAVRRHSHQCPGVRRLAAAYRKHRRQADDRWRRGGDHPGGRAGALLEPCAVEAAAAGDLPARRHLHLKPVVAAGLADIGAGIVQVNTKVGVTVDVGAGHAQAAIGPLKQDRDGGHRHITGVEYTVPVAVPVGKNRYVHGTGAILLPVAAGVPVGIATYIGNSSGSGRRGHCRRPLEEYVPEQARRSDEDQDSNDGSGHAGLQGRVCICEW